MLNLIFLLIYIFGGVALIVVLTQRFGKPLEPEEQAKLSRWFFILVGLAVFAGAIQYLVS